MSGRGDKTNPSMPGSIRYGRVERSEREPEPQHGPAEVVDRWARAQLAEQQSNYGALIRDTSGALGRVEWMYSVAQKERAEVMSSVDATAAQVEKLKTEVGELRVSLKSEISDIKGEVNGLSKALESFLGDRAKEAAQQAKDEASWRTKVLKVLRWGMGASVVSLCIYVYKTLRG